MKLKEFEHCTVQGCEGRRCGFRSVIRLYDPRRFACYADGLHRGVTMGERNAVRWLSGESVAEHVPGVSQEGPAR